MEACIAPYTLTIPSIFFRCTDKFCGRCFGERVGYVTPATKSGPNDRADQPRAISTPPDVHHQLDASATT